MFGWSSEMGVTLRNKLFEAYWFSGGRLPLGRPVNLSLLIPLDSKRVIEGYVHRVVVKYLLHLPDYGLPLCRVSCLLLLV